MKECDPKLSYAVIGKAMEVHRELGPGLDEQFYHRLLSAKLTRAGIAHRVKPKGRLEHRGLLADEFEADLIVEDSLIPELKALDGIFAADHFTQTICYLKFWKIATGILFDFGKESLVQKRIIFHEAPLPPLDLATSLASAPIPASDRSLAAGLCAAIERIYRERGLGYRDTSYQGLLSADLMTDKIPFEFPVQVVIRSGEATVGDAKLHCHCVAGRCAVMVLALHDSIRAADRAVMQSYLCHLRLPWGIVVNFGKKQLEVRHVAHSQQ